MNNLRDIANFFLRVLPISACFTIKRILYRLAGADIGANVSINGHCWFYGRGKIIIEANTWIGVGCKFYSVKDKIIEIGKNCDIAPEVIFIPGTHKMGSFERRAGKGYGLDIKIGNGSWIGARTTILGGVTIGSGVVIAAGSVVNSDIPDNCLAAGVPAVVKKLLQD